jgi:hypothetical protein
MLPQLVIDSGDWLTMRFSHLFVGGVTAFAAVQTASSTRPSVTTLNGTYGGLHSSNYGVESFLGIPYAQPPVGPLRYRLPQPVNSTWSGTRNATEYGNQCVGYGVCETIVSPLSES